VAHQELSFTVKSRTENLFPKPGDLTVAIEGLRLAPTEIVRCVLMAIYRQQMDAAHPEIDSNTTAVHTAARLANKTPRLLPTASRAKPPLLFSLPGRAIRD
jgi:Lon protease-like protein